MSVVMLLTLCIDAQACEPRSVVERFIDAWNRHDAAAFGRLMAIDADWVTASGKRLRGRDQIRAFLGDEHSSWARITTMRASNVHVRPLDADRAVVLFEWEIETPGEGEAERSVARGNNLFVIARGPQWSITAGQVVRLRPR